MADQAAAAQQAVLAALPAPAAIALRVFDVIYVLVSINEQFMSMSIYARQRLIDFSQTGYGSAASTLLFFIVALATVVLLAASRVRLGEE